MIVRSKEFPSGSARHGYEFVAPIDADGYIDIGVWRVHRDRCKVVRFAEGNQDQVGRLVRKPGSNHGAYWMFDYTWSATRSGKAGCRFSAHVFAPGHYVTISGHNEKRVFRVVSIEAAA